MRIALAQINTTVGDLSGNAERALRTARQATEKGAVLVVLPELTLNGYPPRDLVEKPSFLERTEQTLQALAQDSRELPCAIVCGYVGRSESAAGNRAMNRAAVLHRGQIVFRQTKMLLPTYDVFDEARHFMPGQQQATFAFSGHSIALTICEDAWNDKQFWERRLYQRDPVEELMAAGGDVLVSINASPYHRGKRALRREIFAAAARHHRVPVVYVNQVGGNDSLVFDGSSFAMDAEGAVIASGKSFEEDLIFCDVEACAGDSHENRGDECEAVYEALVLGTRDYIRKCGFRRVLLGLSGGIDSSLTAVIAVDAVGPENVFGVSLPGPFSSDHSLSDARALAQALGIGYDVIPISSINETFLATLAPVFRGAAPDVTEENIQARIRGVVLMALSNKWGALVLTTGNKSELAVGYCTLYGDMCGGLAVISDVPKTMVYELSRVANSRHPGAIPENVFTKPPSAELRPDQRDSDSLPDYEVLDRILAAYIEDYQSPQQIAASQKLPLKLVSEIVNKVDRNEYKRQQAAPGLKVTSKAFGIGRRFPIAQRYIE
jgi:NAD+ synthase/NAD+ synthase (glutamine-hydrolysing)